VSQLNAIIGPLQQASESAQADLSKLRIEKWKVDSGSKKQTLANVESIKRNLQSALPEIIGQLQSSPEDLSATFKLYRNLDALYDVFGSVAELAGAFGSKDEFQALSNDLNGIERSRRSLGERLENLTASKEAELAQLRTQVKTLQAAPPQPPKKIVVDDNEPPKKPAAKKKPVPKPPKPTPPAQQAPAQPTSPQQ
jgi:DNA repair exonuclease SbcCD ATPase subunit